MTTFKPLKDVAAYRDVMNYNYFRSK